MGALLTGALMLALVACAGQSGGTGSSMIGPSGTQVFNDADVTFLQQMIMHHQQAIAMAKIAESRAQDPNVKQLAADGCGAVIDPGTQCPRQDGKGRPGQSGATHPVAAGFAAGCTARKSLCI